MSIKSCKFESVKTANLGKKNCFSFCRWCRLRLCVEAVLLMFGIFRGTKYLFFYVIGNGVDDLFEIENKAGREFIGTNRCSKKFFDLGGGGQGAIYKCDGDNGKSVLLFVIWSFSSLIYGCMQAF